MQEEKTMKRTDSELKQALVDELRWDTRVKETDVGVEVRSGIVTLTGTVESYAAKLGAQEAAHRVHGVLDVANDMHVRLPGSFERTDADIAQSVRNALQWDVLVPDDNIRSTVSYGVVTLEGTVDTWNQYDDAARSVRNLMGVVELRNLLRVEPPKIFASPVAVRIAIEQAMERHARHAARHVHLAISDGKVTLSGAVPTWSDRQAVEGAVRGTPGVRKVDNQISISA
jgi:osmotically-inducible protein OsmY